MELPQEFLARMKDLLADEFPSFLQTYEEPRRYGLRVNTLKISVEEFQKIAPFHLTPIPWIENGFFYEKEDAPSRHPFYYAGLYYLQEPSAMTPAQILPVTPGERVLDLCAAPGGKATALAAKLQGKGLLVANDISASRARALLKNLEVFGVINSFVTNTTPNRLAAQFPEAFDKILVDAPCSGEGMFRKDISNARAWSLAKVKECAKTQKEIILQAVSMLRPGGLLLYSTCTFSPEEDEQVIAYLLENCPEMELLSIPMAEGYSCGRQELACEDWQLRLRTGQAPAVSASAVSASAVSASAESASAVSVPVVSAPAGSYLEEAEFLRENAVNQNNQNQSGTCETYDLSRCVRIFPHKMPGEGHFIALLRKRTASFSETSYTASIDQERCIFRSETEHKPGNVQADDGANRQKNEPEDEKVNSLKNGSVDEGEIHPKNGSVDEGEIYPKNGQMEEEEAHPKNGQRNGRKRREKTRKKDQAAGISKKSAQMAEKQPIASFLHNLLQNGKEKDVTEDPGLAPTLEKILEMTELHGNQAYYVQKSNSLAAEFSHIPFLRNGLYLGEIKKERFIPSQALAMALHPESCAAVLNFKETDERLSRYLGGETLEVEDLLSSAVSQKGWQLVCVNGFPLGWGRLTDGILKNKYHPGWRIK